MKVYVLKYKLIINNETTDFLKPEYFINKQLLEERIENIKVSVSNLNLKVIFTDGEIEVSTT